MWLFLPGGLLMPAEFPADLVDPKYMDDAKTFDLQVRARVVSHLENFIRDYLVPLGLEHSEIQKTPEMDYNCRIYMRRADFAVAIGQAILDIDFEKFKPTAERTFEDGTPMYEGGKAYHGVLNSIWGTVCRLGSPGGIWAAGGSAWGAARSKYTGRTYGDYSAGRYRPFSTVEDYVDRTARAWEDSTNEEESDPDNLWNDLIDANFPVAEDQDEYYVPASHERRQMILESVEGIPASEWADWLTETELRMVQGTYERELAREQKSSRGGKRRRNRGGKRRQSKQAANSRR